MGPSPQKSINIEYRGLVRKGEGSEIALLSKADGKRISITGAFPEAQIDGFFKKLTAQKPCRRVFELMAFDGKRCSDDRRE